jgi:hypothetical protein
MENRLNEIALVQKLKKLESFYLPKPSGLRPLACLPEYPSPQGSPRLPKRKYEGQARRTDNWKKIQQIYKFSFEGDSKSPSFVTLYQPFI